MPPSVPAPLRWWEALRKNCWINVPVIDRAEHIDLIGFVKPSGCNGGPVWEKNFVDREFEYYRQTHPIEFDDRAYNVIRDTFVGVNKSVLKYDNPEGIQVPPDIWEASLAAVKRQLSFLEGQCVILPMGQVEIVKSTSPGYVYTSTLGCKTKEEAVRKHFSLVAWFWFRAHIEQYPVLWKQSGKVELAKRAKLDNNDIRGFTVSPVDLNVSLACMNDDFDKKLLQYGNAFERTSSRYGMVMQHGGFSAYWQWMAQGRPAGSRFTSSDVDKFDAAFKRALFEAEMQVRFMAWDKKGITVEEWWERMNYYYQETIESYIVLPTGQVVQKHTGNPSGKKGTTVSNIIGHMLVKEVAFRYQTGLGASPLAEREKKEHVRDSVYGDDGNDSVSPKYAPYYDFTHRSRAYSLFRWTLSQTKDVDTGVPLGHTWLGKLVGMWNGHYVPIVKPDKVLCSLRNLEARAISPGVRYVRALALLVESTFTEPLQTWLRAYVHHLFDQGAAAKVVGKDRLAFGPWLTSVPTHEDCVRFWLGQEARVF